MISIGDIIKSIIEILDIDQKILAAETGVSETQISRIITGERTIKAPSRQGIIRYMKEKDNETLMKIASKLKKQLEESELEKIDGIIKDGNELIESDVNSLQKDRIVSFIKSVIILFEQGKARQNPIWIYIDCIKHNFEKIKMLDFKKPFDMDKLYIELTVHDYEGCDCISIERGAFDAKKLVENTKSISVVLGEPGMGKTTMMKYIAFQAINTYRKVPIFISLHEYSTIKDINHVSLEDFIISEIKEMSREITLKDIIWENTVVLLDGLDEVYESHGTVIKKIKNFIYTHPKCQVIVTSRIIGFCVDDFNEYDIYRIDKLSFDKIKKFIIDWFKDEPQLASDLINKLEDNKNKPYSTVKSTSSIKGTIYELAENPFLLSTICIVFADEKELPKGRFELYEKCTENLRKWFKKKHIGNKRTTFDSVTRNKVLREIAYKYFKDNIEIYPKNQFKEYTKSLLAASDNVDDFLDEVCCDSGILSVNKREEYYFIHRSFHEYYTACKLYKDKIDVLIHAGDSRWEEPIRLYAAQIKEEKEGTDFFEALWGENMDLALRCYRDMSGVIEAELIQKLLKDANVRGQIELVKGLTKKLSNDKVIETLKVLILERNKDRYLAYNGEVLYWGAEVIKEIGKKDTKDDIIKERFGTEEEISARRSALIKEHFDSLVRDPADTKRKDNMVEIPGGIFDMGSPEGEAERRHEESLHKVQLSSFYMSKFAVTNALYKEFDPSHKSYTEDADHPVTNVNWYEATMFCQWLGCKLPTEAQWEYACRGGEENIPYNTGKTITKQQANYNSDKPVPVNSFIPNQYGLYNMHGNVWEWCEEWFGGYNRGEMEVNPTGPQLGSYRVLRGGSFIISAGLCRSACRNSLHPGNCSNNIGFRLVCFPQFGGSL